MIQSKFQHTAIPAFWILLSMIILLWVGELYYVYSRFTNFQRGEIHRDVIIGLVIISGFLLYISVWLKKNATIITIDTEKNTISFENIFTKNTKTYFFSDFDGYIETVEKNRKTHVQYKVLYLVKDKITNRKIPGFLYSNIEELQEGLKSLNYLGFKSFGIVKQLKILFRQPILE